MCKCGVRTDIVITFSLENAGQKFPPFRRYVLQSTYTHSLTHSEEGSTYLGNLGNQ